MTESTKKFSLIVEIDLETLTAKYMDASENEAESASLLSMIEFECQWIKDSGIYVKEIQEINHIEGFDFQAAEHAIHQDGSFLHRKNSRWGIFDTGEVPDNLTWLAVKRRLWILLLWLSFKGKTTLF
jgi:hypothetical protein